MKKIAGQILLGLITTLLLQAQPYNGTIFVDSDIITSEDSSAYTAINSTGRGMRTLFDRRVNAWITVDAFLFELDYDDSTQIEAVVNPEFGDEESARKAADKYAHVTGQLPACLRKEIRQLWINQGTEAFGGGNNSLLIHTGQSILYEQGGILEETLVHEASHTSLDPFYSRDPAWLVAQENDPSFISSYARQFPDREDIAESFLLWLAVRFRSSALSPEDRNKILSSIPNRLAFFDGLNCDLHPFIPDMSTPVDDAIPVKDLKVFPNPVADKVHYALVESNEAEIHIFDLHSNILFTDKRSATGILDLSSLQPGIYILEIRADNKQVSRRKIVKI